MREKKEETEKGKQREPRSKSSNQNRLTLFFFLSFAVFKNNFIAS
jgi:hypothetical protein